MSISGYLKITRPLNSLVSGAAAVVALIITGAFEPAAAVLMFFIVAFICGAGNVLNDYYDYEIDKINRPNRPIPSGSVPRKKAFVWAVILFAAGLVLTLFLNNPACAVIALVNSVLLIIYAAKLKRMIFWGNICVSYLAASIFIFGGALSGNYFQIAPLFAVTFFATLSREILKDAEDIEGDSVCGAKTLAIVLGVKKSGRLAAIFAVAAAASTAILYVLWGWLYLVLIAFADIFILASVFSALKCDTSEELKKSGAVSRLKYGMFAALAVFLIMAVLSALK